MLEKGVVRQWLSTQPDFRRELVRGDRGEVLTSEVLFPLDERTQVLYVTAPRSREGGLREPHLSVSWGRRRAGEEEVLERGSIYYSCPGASLYARTGSFQTLEVFSSERRLPLARPKILVELQKEATQDPSIMEGPLSDPYLKISFQPGKLMVEEARLVLDGERLRELGERTRMVGEGEEISWQGGSYRIERRKGDRLEWEMPEDDKRLRVNFPEVIKDFGHVLDWLQGKTSEWTQVPELVPVRVEVYNR